MSELHKPAIAILASGGGSAAGAVIDASQDGRLDAEIPLIICSKPPEEAGIYDRIGRLNRRYGLQTEVIHISQRTHPLGDEERGQTDEESATILDKVARQGIGHVALMGYMRIVRGELLDEYGWFPDMGSDYLARMSNTHPGPLPLTADTYGIDASQKVLDAKLDRSAHSLHLVASGVDTGPLLLSTPFGIDPETDDAASVFAQAQLVEKKVLPSALNDFLTKQQQYDEEVDEIVDKLLRNILGSD